MPSSAASSQLKQIPVAQVERNEENPRILFRQQEMDQLLESIRIHGIQVPVSVYRERKRYVLIDGERRWRCALKLNLGSMPALVQDKPDKLTNILLMFNIHALREQWDLLTIALKLRDIIALLETQNGKAPTEVELAKHTGLTQGVIRRCRLLLGLPKRYREMILKELQKPKSMQKLTEDFFIEMERALKTVERAMPEVIPDKDRVRKVLIKKFKADVIPNRVHFRDMAKIARAGNVASDEERAQKALGRLFEDNRYSIVAAYDDSVSDAYAERDIMTRLEALIERLEEVDSDHLEEPVRESLHRLFDLLVGILDG